MADLDILAGELRDFYLRSQRIVDRMMRAEGVSLARCRLLAFIARGHAVRSADVATEFSYSPRTVTEAIDALERDGLVARAPDPADRRAKHLTITDAGREALAASEPPRQRFLTEVFGSLPAEKRTELSTILAAMNKRLRELES